MDAADPLIPTIFHTPWWLNAASGGNYEVAEVVQDGRVVGRLPYLLHRRFGVTTGIMPPLTYFLGPAIAEQAGSSNTKFLKSLAITEQLIAALPPVSSFYIKCHRGIKDVLAFQKAGFRTSVQFTYEVYPQAIDDIWKGVLHKRRNVIRRALKETRYDDTIDSAELMRFCRHNLQARGLESFYSMDTLEKLVEASLSHGRGRITGTRDAQGRLSTALFCVWDEASYYFLVGTRSPNYYKGSMSLLVWEAIKDAVARNLIFDFHGVSNAESVSFYSGFGATIVPRYIVRRESRAMRMAKTLQHMLWPANSFC